MYVCKYYLLFTKQYWCEHLTELSRNVPVSFIAKKLYFNKYITVKWNDFFSVFFFALWFRFWLQLSRCISVYFFVRCSFNSENEFSKPISVIVNLTTFICLLMNLFIIGNLAVINNNLLWNTQQNPILTRNTPPFLLSFTIPNRHFPTPSLNDHFHLIALYRPKRFPLHFAFARSVRLAQIHR